MACDWPKVMARGGERMLGKKDFFKRMVVAYNQHGHRAQKDNQLGCKCSPKGGLG